ncbi:MAG: hypothetical protein GY804_10855 [Alphaproteobacteria bacterium]|nr:hypothetical protein [Alphaproteobacteria bacterium]
MNIKNITKNPQGGMNITASVYEEPYSLLINGEQLIITSTPTNAPHQTLSDEEKDNLLGFVCGFSSSKQIAKTHKDTLSNLQQAIILARIEAKQPIMGMEVR